MAASAYHVIPKEVENCVFRHNCIFRQTCMYKQPTLTKQWNYNNFTQLLHSYLRYTDRLLDVFFFVAPCNIIRTSWKSKKKRLNYRKKYLGKFVWRASLFWLHFLATLVTYPKYLSLPTLKCSQNSVRYTEFKCTLTNAPNCGKNCPEKRAP